MSSNSERAVLHKMGTHPCGHAGRGATLNCGPMSAAVVLDGHNTDCARRQGPPLLRSPLRHPDAAAACRGYPCMKQLLRLLEAGILPTRGCSSTLFGGFLGVMRQVHIAALGVFPHYAVRSVCFWRSRVANDVNLWVHAAGIESPRALGVFRIQSESEYVRDVWATII